MTQKEFGRRPQAVKRRSVADPRRRDRDEDGGRPLAGERRLGRHVRPRRAGRGTLGRGGGEARGGIPRRVDGPRGRSTLEGRPARRGEEGLYDEASAERLAVAMSRLRLEGTRASLYFAYRVAGRGARRRLAAFAECAAVDGTPCSYWLPVPRRGPTPVPRELSLDGL